MSVTPVVSTPIAFAFPPTSVGLPNVYQPPASSQMDPVVSTLQLGRVQLPPLSSLPASSSARTSHIYGPLHQGCLKALFTLSAGSSVAAQSAAATPDAPAFLRSPVFRTELSSTSRCSMCAHVCPCAGGIQSIQDTLNSDISNIIASVAAPLLVSRCGTILTDLLDAERQSGQFPISRSRREEVRRSTRCSDSSRC